ncbi:MAG: hypothetical protein IIA17_09160 [candidate division Zixibacteria bacterium]|nr:hypothetical protein [candidate division Zixibacteria bacterium]
MDKNQNEDNRIEDLLTQMEQIPDDYEPNSRYFEINEFSNAIDSLKRAHAFLSNLDDPYRWKWVSISLVNALYGLMVCVLRVGNYKAVIDFDKMDKKPKKKLSELWRSNSTEDFVEARKLENKFIDSGTAILIPFLKALERIQDEKFMKKYSSNRTIEISQSEKANILELRKAFRNQFEHYRPLSWMIDQRVFIPIVRDTLSIVKKLLNSFNLKVHNTTWNIKDAISLCIRTATLLVENEKYLDGKIPSK